MLPRAEADQKWDPPCSPGPHDQCYTINERLHARQIGHMRVVQQQAGAGIRAYGGGSHDHPQKRREIFRGQLEEKYPIAEQSNEYRVKRQADAPKHMGQDDQASAVFGQVIRDAHTEQNQRLCADDRDQLPPVNNIRVLRRVEK